MITISLMLHLNNLLERVTLESRRNDLGIINITIDKYQTLRVSYRKIVIISSQSESYNNSIYVVVKLIICVQRSFDDDRYNNIIYNIHIIFIKTHYKTCVQLLLLLHGFNGTAETRVVIIFGIYFSLVLMCLTITIRRLETGRSFNALFHFDSRQLLKSKLL